MMRYNRIKEFDTTNGVGIRVSLWTQGCSKRCLNCFNKETWDFNNGHEMTVETINHIIDLLSDRHLIKRDFSVLGGEPLEKVNIPLLTELLQRIKNQLPDVNVWIWTSKQFNEIKNLELLKYIDVLIDGEFKTELYSPKLRFRGSSNQSIIDVKESLKQNKKILAKQYYESE